MTNRTERNPRTTKKPNKSGLNKVTYHITWFLIFLVFILASAAIGGFLGYKAAVNSRMTEYSARLQQTINDQYNLAVSDYEEGNFKNAKIRLDYLSSIDNNPDVAALYEKVIAEEDSLVDKIKQAIDEQDWSTALTLYESLSNKDYDYRRSEIEGLIYIAFRSNGVDLIRDGYLESGIKNIDFAGNIGPVDTEADELRIAARNYMTASGYWDIDWMKAMELFSNVALTMPDIFDRASMLTAQQRYVRCSYEVGKQQFFEGNYCAALYYYRQGLTLIPDKSVQATADYVNLFCLPTATITPTPTVTPTPTITPTLEEGYYYYYYY